jgi:hypothetical protein
VISLPNPKELKKALVVILSSGVLVAGTVGVYEAIHSPLFLVQVVEVTTQNADQISLTQAHPASGAIEGDSIAALEGDPGPQTWTPVDAQQISDLASVPLGEVNLFDLDLRGIEKRILKNEWIREVRLQKRFPQTLSITAIFRKPKAIISLDNGSLAYVDSEGKVFGKVSLLAPSDLPVLSGFEVENAAKLAAALQVTSQWEKSSLGPIARIESLNFDPERGYRAMVTYEMGSRSGKRRLRTRVDLGGEKEVLPEGQLAAGQVQRLTRVFEYLRHNSIAARQIFADAGKKIVVKSAHGS